MGVVAGEFGDQRTPQQLLIDALNEADEYEQLILVVQTKGRDIRIGWSRGYMIDHIGMLQFATHQFCAELAESE